MKVPKCKCMPNAKRQQAVVRLLLDILFTGVLLLLPPRWFDILFVSGIINAFAYSS